MAPVSTKLRLDDEGRVGVGICRDRQSVREYVAHLHGRVHEQAASLAALKANSPAWFAASAAEHRAWAVPGEAPQRVQSVFDALDNGDRAKNRVLALAVFGPGLDAGDPTLSAWLKDDRDRALQGKATAIRDLVAEMRRAGIPVEGSPSTGYHLCAHPGQVAGYIAGEAERINSTVAHAKQVSIAGALWYPTAEEQEASDAWRSQWSFSERSEHITRRERGREEALRQSKAEVKAVGKAAADNIRAGQAWAVIVEKRRVGTPKTRTEEDLEKEMKQAQNTAATGRYPNRHNGRQHSWDPRPAAKPSSKKPVPPYQPPTYGTP
jgi:hypothetical protein